MSLMDIDEWPQLSGQLHLFDAVEPCTPLFTGGFDDGEYHLFNDGIDDQCPSTSSVWSRNYADVYNSSCLNSSLSSSPEQYSLLVSPTNGCSIVASDSTPALPASPEVYGEIQHYQSSEHDDLQFAAAFPDHADYLPTVEAAKFSGATAEFVQQPSFTDDGSAGYGCAVVLDVCQLAGLVDGEEDMLFELDDLTVDAIIDREKLASIGPVLPSVSIDEVLSLLSPKLLVSSPDQAEIVASQLSVGLAPSPDASSTDTTLSLPASPGSSVASPACAVICNAAPVTEKRLRKKEQNKTAAQRYREKKRGQQGTVLSEYETLEKCNVELRTKVDSLTKEIAYLKGLIEEICS